MFARHLLKLSAVFVVIAGMTVPVLDLTRAASSLPAAHAHVMRVAIHNFAFAPAVLKIKAGTKVVWTNRDAAAHTVTFTSGARFDSGALVQGASYTHTFKKAGTFTYICSIHPFMKARVIVGR